MKHDRKSTADLLGLADQQLLTRKMRKRSKTKWDKTKSMKELRARKEFKKKSVKRRDELQRAAYIQKKYRSND